MYFSSLKNIIFLENSPNRISPKNKFTFIKLLTSVRFSFHSMQKICTILLILFLVGFFGDLGTQLYAVDSSSAKLFKPYWVKHGRIGGAFGAGLLTLVFGGLMLGIAYWVYTHVLKLNVRSWTFVIFATCIGFILGVVADLITNKYNLIPTLRKWYDGMGDTRAALWSGGLAFALVTGVTSMYMAIA